MDKKAFTQITKHIFVQYGFTKYREKYILILDDVTIIVKFCSWRGVQSFNYYFSINCLWDTSVPLDKRFDTLVEIKMEHSPLAQGYHKHEIIFEKYEENEYRDLLTNMLHLYFDSYKNNALQFLRDHANCMCLSEQARRYLNCV